MLPRLEKRGLVLITGAHGFLGQNVVRLMLDESQYELVLTAREKETLFVDIKEEARVRAYYEMDITNRARVREIVQTVKPDIIVNCAGFVQVDECEGNRERAWKANVSGVEHLAEAARKSDARIIHVSTDYVFDGARIPYSESDAPHPLNYYGRTKLASENALRTSGVPHTIIRTSSLYGAGEKPETNLAMKILFSLQSGTPVEAWMDISTTPTLVEDVALAIVRAAEKQRTGLYHVSGPELLTRYEFALRVARAFQLDETLVHPISYAEWKARPSETPKAERPQKSAFVTLKAQTDLALKICNIEEGLHVMERGIHELAGENDPFVYE